MIYFISDGEFTKIGVTKSIESRLRDIQCGNPRDLEVKALVKGSFNLERKLHKYFKKSRIRGEWYKISNESIEGVIKDWNLIQLEDFTPYNNKKIKVCAECGNDIHCFDSIAEGAEYFDIDHSSIAKVCRGERKTAGKCRWMYKTDSFLT